jgi:DNA-binding transcriptional LysR family regulator
MQLAAPPFHALANLEEVYPADLNGQDFVGFDEDLSIRKELERFFRTHGVAVNLVMHFDNIQMIKEAGALGRWGASAFCRRAPCRRKSSRGGW